MKALLLLSMGFFLAAPPLLAQDTVVYGSKIRVQKGDRLYKDEYLTLQKGKLYHTVNRQSMEVDSIYFLPNGIEVHPDGVYRALNGYIYTLRDGEVLDVHGHRYSSIYAFNKNKRMRQKEIDKAQEKEYR